MSGRGRGGPALFRPPNRAQSAVTGNAVAAAPPAAVKPLIAALRPTSDDEADTVSASTTGRGGVGGDKGRGGATAGLGSPGARHAGVVIHVGSDYGIISDDANGGRRYKFRVRDVRPPGAPTSARSSDDAAARAAFASIQVRAGEQTMW